MQIDFDLVMDGVYGSLNGRLDYLMEIKVLNNSVEQ